MLLLQGIQLSHLVDSRTMGHNVPILLEQSSGQEHTATEQLRCRAGRL